MLISNILASALFILTCISSRVKVEVNLPGVL